MLQTNTHPHPLIFIEEGKNDIGEVICCSRCKKALNPPAFSCSICNFHIHQSCIDLPRQIHTHFHPQHTLNRTRNNIICKCCFHMPSGDSYKCSECVFQIDIKCALSDTKQSGLRSRKPGNDDFRHFSHPHPLVFIPEKPQDQDVDCLVCELRITGSGSVYFCSHWDSHFHKDCAELPREIRNHDYHPHPLLLFPEPFMPDDTYCNSCNNQCRNFYYSCPECDFNLHISCLSSNFNHKHSFTKFRNKFLFVCQACGKKENGFWWLCINCHLLVHKECSQLPLILRTYGHRPHDLTLTYFRNSVDLPYKIYCKICNEEVIKRYAGYGCYQCSYFAHLDCARRQRIDINPQSMPIDALDSPTDPINGDDLKHDLFRHFSHKHDLTFSPHGELEPDRLCDGCMKCLSSPYYGCTECDFSLHKGCAKLARKKRHFFHEHPLALVSFPDFAFHCNACLEYFHGFAYHCEKCPFTLDVRCSSINIPFNHSSHEHALSLYRSTNEERDCNGCGKGLRNKTVFRCVTCNFYLDSSCATLPISVRYRFDIHPLKLTFVDEEEKQDSEYYCDVCEEERDRKVWFYSCKICCFAGHIGCVIGEFPYLKSGMCEGHSHPLRLVMKKKGSFPSDLCANCDKSCCENFAYKCDRCKFSVHGIGPCYHQQLVQGKLTFIMTCSYSPAIGIYEHPIQNQKNEPMHFKLGEYGGKGGSPWEDLFSRIRRFVIYNGQCIDSIQIEYDDKNGNTILSPKHGGNGGSRSEVVFEYPDEYLISINGYYGNTRNWGSFTATLIRSLTIKTNRRSYGAFGVEDGTEFSIPAPATVNQVKIVGVYGRSGLFLDSIGLYGVSIQS